MPDETPEYRPPTNAERSEQAQQEALNHPVGSPMYRDLMEEAADQADRAGLSAIKD